MGAIFVEESSGPGILPISPAYRPSRWTALLLMLTFGRGEMTHVTTYRCEESAGKQEIHAQISKRKGEMDHG